MPLIKYWDRNIWLSAGKKFKGGGKDNRPLFFQNNRLLFLLLFLLFFENFRGGKCRFGGCPPAAGSQISRLGIGFSLVLFSSE